MPHSKEGIAPLKPCPEELVKALQNFIKCFTLQRPQELHYYCRETREERKAGKATERPIDVYALQDSLNSYLKGELPEAELVFAGVHIARVYRRSGRLKIIPMLGLAQLLRVYTGITNGYVKVAEKGEQLFLYGRDVLPESILELKGGEECSIVVVLNRHGEPLGWGRIVRRANSIYIQNLIDAGWYLRSGV